LLHEGQGSDWALMPAQPPDALVVGVEDVNGASVEPPFQGHAADSRHPDAQIMKSGAAADDAVAGDGQPYAVPRQGDGVHRTRVPRTDWHAVGRLIETEPHAPGPGIAVPDANDLVEAAGIKRLIVGTKRQGSDQRGGPCWLDAKDRLLVADHHRLFIPG